MKTTIKKASRAVGMRRLLALADFLDDLPPKRFNYSHWVGPEWQGDQKLSCGTTACALGWAPSVPSIAKAGLRMVKGPVVYETPEVAFTVRRRLPADWKSRINELSLEATAAVFGIDEEEEDYLFRPGSHLYRECDRVRGMPESPSAGASAKTVARHIRRFVKWKRAQP